MKRYHEPAETAEKTPAARPPSGEAGHGPERASSRTRASLPLAMATEQVAARRRRASEARRSRPRSPARMRACATTSVIAHAGVQLAAKHPAGIAGIHEDQRDQGDRAHEHKDLAARSGCSGAHTLPAEEHDCDKPRFEEEDGGHLLGYRPTDNRPREAENTDQFVPNRWDITMPDRTPMANEIAKIFTQWRNRLRYVLSARRSHRALSTAVAGKPCGQDWKETAPGRREGELDPCRRSRVEAG